MTATTDDSVVLGVREHAAILYHYPTSTFAREWFRFRVWARSVGNERALARIAEVDHHLGLFADSGRARETSEIEVS